jgi:predicted DNA-binding transcriptional regulator YafY
MPNPEEYRRTCRIVDLLLRIIRQPRRWTRRALAEHYELSEQQMDKDIQLLRHGLRMPLCHVRDGYYFERSVTLPILTLSLPEALSLLLAARLGYTMPGVPRGDLAAAIARVEALLPQELLPLVNGLDRGGQDDRSPAGLLRELQMAIAERAQLRIAYRSASHPGTDPTPCPSPTSEGRGETSLSHCGRDVTPASAASRGVRGVGESRGEGASPPLITHDPSLITSSGDGGERVVDPYTLIPYLRSWYLVAYCHLRGEVRMFKVDRIDRLGRTGESFAFPRDFDVAGYMGHTWGLLRGEAGEPEDVVLEFEPESGRWIRDQQLHESQRAESLPDGRVRLSFYVGITPELRRWVLGFGRQVRVVTPAHLAEWVLQEARGMVEEGSRCTSLLEAQDG